MRKDPIHASLCAYPLIVRSDICITYPLVTPNFYRSVLLDEFVLSVERAKKEEEQNILQEKEKRKLRNCLDPVTKSLLTFEDDEDLDAKINLIFDILDEDESGGLNFEVPQKNTQQLKVPAANA